MNKRRLLKLADLLEADAKKKKGIQFHYGEWGIISETDRPVSCGTHACALGLAAISGAFKRVGLSYSVDQYGYLDFTVDGKVRSPVDAAMAIFDLDILDASYLFIPRDGDQIKGAVAERAVAKKIRKLIAAG